MREHLSKSETTRTPDVLLEPITEELRWANSYSRLPTILKYWRKIPATDFFRILGEQWTTCDNISHYSFPLQRMFNSASRKNLDAMMNEEERESFASLPNTITAYRGAYKVNLGGFSYSLSRTIAERFPTLNRYMMDGEIPYIVTAQIPKRFCVLKLDRKEMEIICSAPRSAKIMQKKAIKQEAGL